MQKIKGMTFYDKPWYNSYRSMMDRCYREKAHNYPQYGGRGIKVCDEWHYIDVFADWVERSGYKEGLTLDRIDPNGDYTPENCRWATRKQQANNRTNTVYVTIDGVTKTLSEWADFVGISRSTISDRYFCKGWRGVMLLHRSEDTRFKTGYNRYANPKHYADAPTIIPASESVKTEEDSEPWLCLSCRNYPPSSTDGKPCTQCDPCEVLHSCYDPAEEGE